MIKKQKIIISCGGTGGHIFPGIEIARAFREANENIEILFVGALGRMEMKKVPQQGFPIVGLFIQGFYRGSVIKNILLPIKIIISLIQAFFILVYYWPHAVVGTGGFASGVLVFLASVLGFKTYIQEQNFFPGLTNRLLGNRANKVFVAHNGMQKFFPQNKLFNLGNPIRQSLKLASKSINTSKRFFKLKPA